MDAVPEPIVRRFTYFDPRERLVVAATAPLDGSEAVVGIADVDMLATGLAELGLVVDDAVQGRGVGRLLAEAAGSLAARQGAARLKAEIYTENEPMLRLMEALGPSVRTLEDDRTVVYVRLPAARRRAA
jgi:RimJ/RimL family protein N-acetyltransferase